MKTLLKSHGCYVEGPNKTGDLSVSEAEHSADYTLVPARALFVRLALYFEGQPVTFAEIVAAHDNSWADS